MTCVLYSNPEYWYDKEENCVHIIYQEDCVFIVDIQDHIDILNSGKRFLVREDRGYPYYTVNGKQVTLLEFIYRFNYLTSEYIFINGNFDDFRRSNVQIFHEYHKTIQNKYEIIQYISGHYNNYGIDAFIMKNPVWIVNDDGKEILQMFCEKTTLTKLCKQSYQKILDYEKMHDEKITWFLCANGYIAGKIKNKQLYIHQVITGCFGNGRGTSNVSVDHIDRDPLNNMMENLRIATREEQEQNSKGIAPKTKRARQTKARPLPDGITQGMLKKYVVYYYNIVDKSKNKARDFFSVEGHPNLQKRWESTKSNKVSIMEKLHQANQKVEELDSLCVHS
jgi:HNH endonuclease